MKCFHTSTSLCDYCTKANIYICIYTYDISNDSWYIEKQFLFPMHNATPHFEHWCRILTFSPYFDLMFLLEHKTQGFSLSLNVLTILCPRLESVPIFSALTPLYKRPLSSSYRYMEESENIDKMTHSQVSYDLKKVWTNESGLEVIQNISSVTCNVWLTTI